MANSTAAQLIIICSFLVFFSCEPAHQDVDLVSTPPNIVLIYADDLGYRDLSSYGATQIQTPAIDMLAKEGILFTDAHASSATCTPSRYSLLTGEYAWRRPGTGIARGDASMIIEPGRTTLPSKLQDAGYKTGVIGKWHLGLGGRGGPDWNGDIKPGPLEIGFDEAFLIPATGDRVPTVYVENYRVVGLDPDDPIEVSFSEPFEGEPLGRDNPDLLRVHPSHGHDMAIVNGISRIGYMKGGTAAHWVDEDMADVITGKAVDFIEKHKDSPFFLFFSLHDIHVPRAPHPRFAGKSGMGPRGDVILQTDWCVEEVVKALDTLGLTDNTIVIFTSDNGPVIDDGYQDQAVELLGAHEPSGAFRGGKYSAFEAGTRVPFILKWPDRVKAGASDALVSQVDLLASFAALVGIELGEEDAVDSMNQLATLLGESMEGRPHLIEHNSAGTLSLIKDSWKYIEPSNARAYNDRTDIELGNSPVPQLYNLDEDIGEQHNLAKEEFEMVEALSGLLEKIKSDGRSRF